MESFYGGKQGRTYKITAHYDSIYDMVCAFQQGGSYNDVNYDEYVIIDTIYRKNQKNNAENGIIYRRGYDFSQAFNPSQVPIDTERSTLQPNQFTETEVTLYADELNIEYAEGSMTSGTYAVSRKVPKYYAYSYKIIDPNTAEIIIGEDSFKTEQWNDDWEEFVTHPGGGAIYVGQIVGPQGDSPAIKMLTWDEWREYTEAGDGSAEQVKNSIVDIPKPGFDYSRRLTDGYDSAGFHDEIQYGYCTLRDLQGNVVGAYIAFDIPYTVFYFEAASVSAYGDPDIDYVANYDSVNNRWSYQNLIVEDEDSQEHNYYKHYHIRVPKGIHGQNIDALAVENYTDDAGDWLVYYTENYDRVETGIRSNAIKLSPYKVISRFEQIRRSDTYSYCDNDGVSQTTIYNYPYQFKVHYTYGDPDVYNYQVIEQVWRQVGNNGNLQNDHIYMKMSSGVLIDCGLLKKIDRIEKDSSDNEYYTCYNDGTRTLLPVSEIKEVTMHGDLFLIRFEHVDDADFYQNYEYQGKNWINLGSVVKGNHVLTNFTSEEELKAAYPNGLGADASTADRAGWVVTIGPDNNGNYSLYAYDYLKVTGDPADKWYKIQEMGANNIKAGYSVLVSKTQDNRPDLPEETDLLNEHGVWFVVTE